MVTARRWCQQVKSRPEGQIRIVEINRHHAEKSTKANYQFFYLQYSANLDGAASPIQIYTRLREVL
jgi:hypothetical protein